MLTADLVQVTRTGGALTIRRLDRSKRNEALRLAEHLLGVYQRSFGESRDEIDGRCAEIEVAPRDEKLLLGLRKLIEDRASFSSPSELDPPSIREELFTRAAEVRRSGARFEREAILAEIAEKRSTTAAEIDRALFADLRSAERLEAGCDLAPQALVETYEQSQVQAVLLRAVKVTVHVRCASPRAYRALFHRMKFLRLLFTIHEEQEGYRLEIDGPFSLFQQVTKYGLELALLVPALERTAHYRLEAEVRWGKKRERLSFTAEGGTEREIDLELSDEITELAERFVALGSEWSVRPAESILSLPGFGLCVPDLVFERGEDRVYLELLGRWSRAALWRRVELVEAGLGDRVLFAASEKLRVSEEVLSGDLPSAIYVYKSTMIARAILERITALAARP
jgi:uncharacterized protein